MRAYYLIMERKDSLAGQVCIKREAHTSSACVL